MKKNVALLLVLALTIGMLAGCNQSPASPEAPTRPDNAIADYVTYQTTANEVETWCPQFSQSAKELDLITNMVEGLLSNNNYGQLVPAMAESWVTNDGGLNWTFNIRQGASWVDQSGKVMADVVAEDWLWGLEWTLNFWKNDSNNTSMPIEMIKGASEYYEYTKAMDETAAKALGLDDFLGMVGISAPSKYVLEYVCITELPYFETLATYNCLYPVSKQLLDNLGVDGYRAVTPQTLWYSGPYTCTTYVQNNEKVFTANPEYWDTSALLFDTVTVKMVESSDIAFQLYQNGEIDVITLTESTLQTIYNNPDHQFHDYLVEARPTKYSYSFHIVYSKNNPDGTPDENWNTAIANEAFRLAWYYGLDTSTYLRRVNAINPINCDNYAYTARNLAFTSAGVDYTDLVHERLGITPSSTEIARLDKAKFEQYKAQAIEELTAKGVTFPVNIDYYIIGSSQTSLDSATVLKQTFIDSLGADFIDFTINTYISSAANEVRTPKLASLWITGWGADYGDPLNFLTQETYANDNAYFSISYSKINDATDPDLIATFEEFTRLVNVAAEITTDKDARYNAFADAEAYYIQKGLAVPLYYNIVWQLTKVNDYSKIYAPYGIQNNRWLNWETNVDGITTEQAAANAAAYEAGKS